jgi:hypothetical protein
MEMLTKKKVLGEVEHFIGSKEQQGRGMIHGHLLLRIKELADCPLNHEWVDKMISARIPAEPPADDNSPAAEQQRRLRRIICTNNLHDCNGQLSS